MNVKRKILPIICLMSAYVRWVKPRLLSASASKGGKSLLLHLCARSRFLIPMIVFTAFWIFDAQMQIEASVSLTLSRNVRITIGPDGPEPELDVNGDDDTDAEIYEDSYSSDTFSPSPPYSHSSDLSMFALDDLESALQEFVESETVQRMSYRNDIL